MIVCSHRHSISTPPSVDSESGLGSPDPICHQRLWTYTNWLKTGWPQRSLSIRVSRSPYGLLKHPRKNVGSIEYLNPLTRHWPLGRGVRDKHTKQHCSCLQAQSSSLSLLRWQWNYGKNYNGTPLKGHPWNEDTSLIRTLDQVPTSYKYVLFAPWNEDTPLIRTHF